MNNYPTQPKNQIYDMVLSFRKLIEYYQYQLEYGSTAMRLYANHVLNEVEKYPVLQGPVEDFEMVKLHREPINLLMSGFISPIDQEKEIAAAVLPLELYPIYQTPAWSNNIDIHSPDFRINGMSMEDFKNKRMLFVNRWILKDIYGLKRSIDDTIICKVLDKNTKLAKYYNTELNTRFLEIVPTGKKPLLPDNVLEQLNEQWDNLALWRQYIGTEDFRFEGFLLLRLTEVTQTEVLSSIKYNLLQKDALTSSVSFKGLELQMRELFGLPKLRLGLVSYNPNQQNSIGEDVKIWNSIIGQEEFINNFCCKDVPGKAADSIYSKVLEDQKTRVVSNLKNCPSRTFIEDLLIEKGIFSLLVAPLVHDGNCIGIIELGSPNINDVQQTTGDLLEGLLPIFSLVAKRTLEEIENKIQRIIKESYTAVHPVVEWRFVEAAINKMHAQSSDQRVSKSEQIVFENVYSLYGQSDIKESSTHRNLAIQADLTEQLSRANAVLASAVKAQPMQVLEELSYILNKFSNNINNAISSSDEWQILHFLKAEVEPLFHQLMQKGQINLIDYKGYFNALDDKLGVVYNKRKQFEESLNFLNDAFSEHIEDRQAVVQKVFPHYCEKFKTDGVEYNLYIGDSINKNQKFEQIYLKELRLWQLQLSAELAIIANSLSPQLSIPLEVTHLILVNSAPIAIRFREDERRFDVDGAYNVRYEIIKKRIDKAYIKGKTERLTQPDTIAIVYTQDHEAEEYLRFIQFLQEKKLLKKPIEYLTLEDLQGVNGLKALRVEVNVSTLP